MRENTKEHTYFVRGMHCASCEVLIEKKLLSIGGVKSVEASTGRGEVLIIYEGKRPHPEKLSRIFKKEGYSFSDEKSKRTEERNTNKENHFFSNIFIALAIIGVFLLLNKSGLAGWINVGSRSSLPAFFVFGLLAGISTCAALVGGLVLSMSKQWLQLYGERSSTLQKLQPHIMFNVGRVLSYLFFGAILGFLGNTFQISLQFTSFLIIAISIMMFFIAMQMLGVRGFNRIQLSLPKFATRYIANEKNFKGKNMPLIMGALTFFLPCGFTITAQGLALVSGNPLQGALIMGFFVLGTAPALLGIGLSTVKLSQKPHLAYKFSRIAGILILFFALYNINSQMNILGFASLSDLRPRIATSQSAQASDKDLAPIVDGKQIIKMDALAFGYSPNYFKIRAGVPVRWEITDKGTSGCTNAVISRNLFAGEIRLSPGKTSTKEFTPQKPGRYKFSCWMGMVSGVIEVVDTQNINSSGSVVLTNTNFDDSDIIPSGASGCGCGCNSGN